MNDISLLSIYVDTTPVVLAMSLFIEWLTKANTLAWDLEALGDALLQSFYKLNVQVSM